MAAQNPLLRAEAALRDHALTYPETREEFPWGHSALKVKGKIFLILSNGKAGADTLSLSVKLPVSGKAALTLPFASPTEYGLGKSGWVSARFHGKDKVPVDMIKEWIDESFRAIAPKRVLAILEKSEATAPPSKTAARKRPAKRQRG
jgi:predicted DNA-binding protein (MmcQ/YjbR family)